MQDYLDPYNVIWTTQSKNSSESMPVSGGDIGLNVWVENDELLVYLGRAGYRDENGALLKAGRVRVKLTPNPFEDSEFRQELKLRGGHVRISAGKQVAIKVWVEVHRPVVHVDVESETPVTAEATYESWRFEDIELPNDPSKYDRRGMCMNFDAYPGEVFLYKDEFRIGEQGVRFHHRVDNRRDCFNFQVKQQGLGPIRDQLVNPLENLVWGGALVGDNMTFDGETSGSYAETPFKGWTYASKSPATAHRLRVCLHIDQEPNQDAWDADLQQLMARSQEQDDEAWSENRAWWAAFWDRSHLVINPGRGEDDAGWRVGRNYQLFRYMLASNVSGREPTMFNGGLFTFDPLYVNGKSGPGYTPDHRQWGGLFTNQNQRMMVWPLLKSGDFDCFATAFSYYVNNLPNTAARVRHYWGHAGCTCEEQSSISGLPAACMYGFYEGGKRGRPADLFDGESVNHAGGNIYEGQLEYAWIMLRYCQFSGADLTPYMPFIEQAVLFYDEHYRLRGKELTGKELDEKGKLVICPANTLECHWEARNPTSVIAGLTRVLRELIALPEEFCSTERRERWQRILEALPDMPRGESTAFGGTHLKPAENYEHESWHCPQMYPLYPYELIGLGQGDLELMQRTSLSTGDDRLEYITWKQANIHAARLGDAGLARDLNAKKMDDGPYRFPAFWPADVDWAPDHNWGGCGMIGMQEMVMQTHSLPGHAGHIRLLPAWPDNWDVDFKLHAPRATTVQGRFESGRMACLTVTPVERKKDLLVERQDRQ